MTPGVLGRILAIPIVLLAISSSARAQSFQVTPSSANFAGAAVGEQYIQDFTVSNTGSAAGQLNASMTGNTFNFAIVAGFSPVFPVTVEPGQQVVIRIGFVATAVESYTATLVISTTDPLTPTINVPLTGSGVDSCAMPTALDVTGGGTITRGAVALLRLAEGQTLPLDSSCSWSPTSGLTNPLQCATFAQPTESTTYQLTVAARCGATLQTTVDVNVLDGDSLVGPPGPQGPAGPEGPAGPQGPLGPQGDPGIGLTQGAYLFLAVGASPPAGFTLVGTTVINVMPVAGGRQQKLLLNVFVKN